MGYDSDDDSLDGLTETNVLLGFACKEPEPDGDVISKLGGRPDWLTPTTTPPGTLATCKNCSAPMALLLQLNAELADRFLAHERRLYVFACRAPKCARARGSVRAMRGTRVSAVEAGRIAARQEAQRVEEEEQRAREERKKTEMAGLGEKLFGGTMANPFSANGSAANPFSATGGNPFSGKSDASLPQTFASALSLGTTTPDPTPAPPPTTTTTTTTDTTPWPQESALPKAYPVLYLAESEYETLEPESYSVPSNARLLPTESEDISTPSGEDKEVFESSMDTTFQRFADRIANSPDQCIRYEFGGVPLLYSRDDAVGKVFGGNSPKIPKCGRCGAGRVFEVQLTPHAIAELEADDVGFDGMEWGTIIVAVCERNCADGSEAVYVEEWAGVQWEESKK